VRPNTWSVKDPANAGFAAEDDWLYLEVQEMEVPATTTATAFTCMQFDLTLSDTGLVIGTGQALAVTISMLTGAGGGTLRYCNAYRTLIGPVA